MRFVVSHEIICVLRYRWHHFMAAGINAEAVAAEFLTHANEEQQHAEYVEGEGLIDMIREGLIAKRMAIDSYREMIDYVGDRDTTTKRMLEGNLAMEEEHADDLVGLLEELKT